MKETIVVQHIKNKEYVGFIYSEHLLPVPTPSGEVEFRPTLGVCWENKVSPAISYHSPEELIRVGVQALRINDVSEYEEDETEDVEGETYEDDGQSQEFEAEA